jgi:hypothetical protein
MKKLFPVLIVDDFLENPDKIRELALLMEYHPNDGSSPGKRTKALHQIDKKLHDYFADKFFSVFYDFETSRVEWSIKIAFQITSPYDLKKDSPYNKGWIHIDDDAIVAGILYLNPDADIDSGTCIYKIKDKKLEQNLLKNKQEARFSLYKNNIKSKEYESIIDDFNSNFIETVTVKNIYNRLIAFDGNNWHSAKNLHSGNHPRLTVVFFAQSVQSIAEPPIIRINNISYE